MNALEREKTLLRLSAASRSAVLMYAISLSLTYHSSMHEMTCCIPLLNLHRLHHGFVKPLLREMTLPHYLQSLRYQ